MIARIPARVKVSAAIGVLIAFSFLILLRLIFAVNGENEVDSFYHVRIALEGWRVYAAQTFPVLTLSTWTECFADKELLFHILLFLHQEKHNIPLHLFPYKLVIHYYLLLKYIYLIFSFFYSPFQI